MTATDGPLARLRSATRRLVGRNDAGAAAELTAAIEGVRSEVAAVRDDLVAFGAASDRTGDRIEALTRRVDELARQIAERDASGDAGGG